MNALAPSSGEIKGQAHFFPVRVYYEDTDAGGMVYHASYLKFAERARTELLRMQGVELSRGFAEFGVIFVLHSADMRFRRPARLDDALTVESTLCDFGVASLNARQVIRRGEDEIFTFNLKLAAVNEAGKPTPMPESLRSKLAVFTK